MASCNLCFSRISAKKPSSRSMRPSMNPARFMSHNSVLLQLGYVELKEHLTFPCGEGLALAAFFVRRSADPNLSSSSVPFALAL